MGKALNLLGHNGISFVQALGRLFCMLCLSVCGLSAAIADQFSVELLDENDGFNTSIVFSIVQDHQGFLWFGTAYDGIMRYDGKNVVNFRRDGLPRYRLESNESGNLLVDKSGMIWVGGWGSSVSVIDPITNQIRYYPHDENDPNTVGDSYIQSLFEDDEGQMWLGARSRGVSRFDPITQTFERFPYDHPATEAQGNGTTHGRIWAINQIQSNELWIGTEFGLNRLNTSTGEFEYLIPDRKLGPTGINKIRQITPLSNDELLLGTHDGVLVFNSNSRRFRSIPVEQDVVLGPIYSIMNTHFGEYWLTTGRGIYAFTEQDETLRKVPLDIDDSCALTVFQDKQNIIWISCEGLGIYKIVPQTFFKTLDHPIAQSAYSLTMANNGKLLIGTEADGVYEWDWQNDRLSPFASIDDKNPRSVNRIMQDNNDRIWSTDNYNLYQIGINGSFEQIDPPAGTPYPNRLTDIKHILQASNGDVWVSTLNGVFVIDDLNLPFKYYGFEVSDDTSLTNSTVSEIYEDRQDRIWLGTQSGLNVWQPESDSFRRFYLPDTQIKNAPDDTIYAIYQDESGRVWAGSRIGLLYADERTGELIRISIGDFSGALGVRLIKGDSQGNLWMVTQVGVLKYNPVTNELREFDERDGLSGARYFVNLATQSDNGTIFISSRGGIHYFDPSRISDDPLTSKTVLTNFEVLGAPDANYTSLAQNNTVALAPDENYVRFDFSTVDLLNGRQIRYRYKLEGLDEQWIDNGTSNTVVYSNLRGGNYHFRVRPVIKNDMLYKDELVVGVQIATPLWRQAWMIVLYAVLMLFIIGYYIRYRQARHDKEILRQKRFVSELEQQVAEKTKKIQYESDKLIEANKVKSQFLANMSHEIRTPLTAVMGLSESIIQGDVPSKDVTGEVGRIHNQSRHLLTLLNDILDVTKIEENKLELEPYHLDIGALLNEINDLFVSHAAAKKLQFSIVKQLPANLIVHVDGLRLKQVLINLISNALKFTEQGHVTVIISQQESLLLFNVVDTGIGMSAKQLENVFDVFTQADSSINRRFGGSGLGLALSRKLVSMMGGELQAKSELDKGSIFTFSIPVTITNSASDPRETASNLETIPKLQGDVLLAEDHPDNRRFIARLLERLGLKVITAKDGIEAIQFFKESQPQLILLDIQMPQKDGIQTFRELRALGATQPIVAITANVMAHDIERYKEIGFDHYLTKPIIRKQLIDIISRYFHSVINVEEAQEAPQRTEFQDLRVEFIARLGSEITEFESAAGKVKEVCELAHRLSGAAQLLEFKELAALAGDLERAARDDSDLVSESLALLLAKMRQLQVSEYLTN